MTKSSATCRKKGPYRSLWWILALIIPAALLGFGKSYFSGRTFSGREVTTLVHMHTAVMVLWVLLLIAQAWLIRAKRFQLHRWMGRSSFVVAPLVMISTVWLAHESLNGKQAGISTLDARFEIYDLLQVVGFGLSWALALVYRRRIQLHVRFMVSTAFAFGSAIVFRIILNWLHWVPGMDVADNPENINNVAAANGTVLVLMLLVLIGLDWRLGIRRSPFWLVTILTVIMHIGFFTFTKSDWWMSFVQWFADLTW